MPDEGILRRRTWVIVGSAFGLILVAVLAATIWQSAQPTAVEVWRAPEQVTWRIGDTARVRTTLAAAAAAGLPAQVGAAGCTMQAGAVGRIVEIGGPLASPTAFVEVQTDGCSGWLPVAAVVRP